MTVHEFHIFNFLGEKSLREALWSQKQFDEAIRFIKMFHPSKILKSDKTEDKQNIIDEMRTLYLKYKMNPNIIGDIFEKYEKE